MLKGLEGRRRKKIRPRGTLYIVDRMGTEDVEEMGINYYLAVFLNYTSFKLDIISDGSIRVTDKNKSVRIFNVGWGGARKEVGMKKKKEEAS